MSLRRSSMPRRISWIVASVLVVGGGGWMACSAPSPDSESFVPSEAYSKQDTMIPMRDGVRLNTEIYIPRDAGDSVPIIFNRTPYGLPHDEDGFHAALGTSYEELARDGYIFVFQDNRGRYGSEGEFVMLRPPCPDTAGQGCVDEGTDAYDTVDWLMSNLDGHNGRVGILGISYPGWLTVMTLTEPHPAVKAISPQASPSDMFIGDDFFHNGAFRLAPGFGYVALMERADSVTPYNFTPADAYEYYLELGGLASVTADHPIGKLPTWQNFVAHPSYDEFWKRQETSHYLSGVTIPTLSVAGWYDAEDFYGPLKIYRRLESFDDAGRSSLVVGPWQHGGWASAVGDSLGPISFGQPTGEQFRSQVQRQWFRAHLKGDGRPEPPEAYVFQTGTNRWQCYRDWPPSKGAETRDLYFREGGRLSFERPGAGGTSYDEYVSDPANPVPYRRRPMPGFWQGAQALWKVEDQRFVSRRPDVLTFETEPLDEPVAIAGPITARLHASTTGTDADWVVKLIDVHPEDPEKDWQFYLAGENEGVQMDGYQLMVAGEVMRARYRSSFEQPEPVTAGTPVEYEIDLRSRNHVFREGHRIMVQVQSTWFPLIDRNPQHFVQNIFRAESSDFRKATHRVYRSGNRASHVELPVVSMEARACDFVGAGAGGESR